MFYISARLDIFGDVEALLESCGFEPYGRVQCAIDGAVLDFTEMGGYVPASPDRTLEFSARLSTDIGSGMVIWNTPYARFQNGGFVMTDEDGRTWVSAGEQKPIVTTRPLEYDTAQNPNAGAHWFERMKADHTKDILDRARAARRGR